MRPLCPECGCPTARNGLYARTLHKADGRVSGRVFRFRCNSCKLGFSVQPPFALRYCRYVASVVEEVVVSRLTHGTSLGRLADMLAKGGVCERTVRRLLAKLTGMATLGLREVGRSLADSVFGSWAWLAPEVATSNHALSSLRRFMNSLYDLACMQFPSIADTESVRGQLLSFYQVWRTGCHQGLANDWVDS